MFQKLPFYTYLKSFVVIFLWYILLWLNKIFFVSWIRFFHELFTLGAFNFGATFILMKDLRQVFFVGVFLRFPMKNNTQIRNYETRNTLWSLYPTLRVSQIEIIVGVIVAKMNLWLIVTIQTIHQNFSSFLHLYFRSLKSQKLFYTFKMLDYSGKLKFDA